MTHIRVERDRGIGTITIDRRERFNSLDVRTAQDFRRAGLLLARDPATRVVILRGLPEVFCSGADLKFIRDGGNDEDLAYLTNAANTMSHVDPSGPRRYGDVFKQILEYIHSAISEIRRAPKPFIAAVDGIAAAGGFGIAMSCDLVIASERASFEWAYGKTALTGAESSTFFLPRLIGLRRAMELVLLNPRLTAERALAYGLINAVVSVDGFDPAVRAAAERIAAGPAHAFAMAKELLNQAASMDRLDDHLDQELQELARAADGPEVAEGIAAFFEKRAPSFQAADASAEDQGLARLRHA